MATRRQDRTPHDRRRRRRKAQRRHAPRLEALEQRLVLSLTPAADAFAVSAAQAAALHQGIGSLTSRLSEIQEAGLLGDRAAALAQPVGTLLPIGDTLRTSLTDRLGAISAARTVGEVKAAFTAAVAADPALASATVTAQLETDGADQRLWFSVDLAGGTELPDYALDLGQASGTGGLFDQGLALGAIEVELTAGFSGTLDFGLDLAAGLSAEQMMLLKFDDLRAFGAASHTGADALADVEARFGVMRLGPADIDVELDIGVTLDLVEPAAGWMTLGELTGQTAADWLAAVDLSASGAGLDVTIPFTLDMAGFDQALGSAHELGITVADMLDPASLAVAFPSLSIPGVPGGFDFSQFAEISATDLGIFLSDIGRWVPELGAGFDLPLVGRDLAGLFGPDIRAEIDGLLDALQDATGAWQFDTVQEMIDLLAGPLGAVVADFQLSWNPTAEAVEWTLPLDYAFSKTESFDASAIVPAGLPLAIGADGSATIGLAAAFEITAGVAISSSANVEPITAATLLSGLNGGAGLSAGMLVDGDDLEFTLRNGQTLGFDLNSLDLATATVQDLIDLVTTPGKLALAIDASRLVATDLTSPASADATFSVAGPSVEVVIGSTTTVQTSLAPIALGLLVASTTGDTLTGSSLEGYSARNRIYVEAGEVGSFTATLSGSLEAGASFGPLSLSIACGKVEGAAAIAGSLVDPGSGDAADGRVYLAEMEDDLAAVIDTTLSAPTLDGIFQLRVPDIMLADPSDPASTGVDPGDYQDYCGGTPLSTLPGASVPYLDLDLSGDWATTGDWSFSITPAGSLPSLALGLGGFSIGDLPGLLDLFVGYLEGSGVWNFELPWVDLSLGDLFGFADIFAGLPEFDLGSYFGLPEYGGDGSLSWPEFSLGGLGGEFLAAFELALPDLSGLDPDLFGRLQRLAWSLDDLIVEWEGWTPGSLDFDLDFLGRVKAWFSGATLAFPDLLPELPSLGGDGQGFGLAFGRLLSLPQFSWQPEADLPDFNLSLDLGWVLSLDPAALDFPGLDFGGLSWFSHDVGQLSLPGGNSLSLTPAFDPSGRLVFTLVVDADYDHTVVVPALDLGGVPLDITTSGELVFDFGGTITGVFGVDLGTGEFFFDDTASGIELTLLVDSTDLAMSASLGGFAGVSLGATPEAQAEHPDWVPASVFLGSSDGASPAEFTVDAAGTVTADAMFTAALPLYVWPGAPPGLENLELGTLGLDAEFSVSPGSGIETPTLEITGIDEIIANLANLSFSFDSWIDGAADLIAYLRTVLAGDLMANLPLVNRIDVSEQGLLGQLEGFFDTVGSYNTAFELDGWLSGKFAGLGYTRLAAKPAPSAAVEQDQFFYTFSTRSGPGQPLVELPFDDDTNGFEILLVDDVELIVDLYIASATTTALAGDQIDFGIDALGLEIVGDASVDLTTAFVLDIGLGASLMRGFFIETDADTEFTAGIDLNLPEDLALKLGPLTFAYESTAVLPELEANLGVDLGSDSYGLTDLGDLFSGITISGDVRAEVDADLSASIFSGLAGAGIGVSLAMGFNDTAAPGGSEVAFADLGADKFFFEITDTFIDLGGLISGPIKELFASVNSFLEPLRPVTDLLTSEVPGLSDVSKAFGGPAVTVLDVMRVTGGDDFDSAVEFIETVDYVLDTVETLSGIAGSSKVSLGSFSLPAGTGGSASAANLRSGFESTAANPGDAGFDAGDAGGEPVAATPADADGGLADTYAGVSGEGKLSFPIFSDPAGSLISLLFGDNPSLIHWDLPSLRAGFTLDQSIPIFPPLFARFFGGFEFATDVSVGYDTRGIRQAMAAEEARAAKVLNGIYLGDTSDAADLDGDGSVGSDRPELSFTATIGAGAELNVVVASASVNAGVEGVLGANLKDNNGDGKVHLDELAANLRSGPECIFDFEGALDLFFEATIKVGVSVPFVGFVTLWKDSYELLNARLFDWELVTCPPVEPDLADIVTGPYDHDDNSATAAEPLPAGVGKALVLNTGPRAGLVLPGETSDGDEEFEIDYDAASGEIIVRAYDVGEDRNGDGEISDDELGQRYPAAGINAILFDAGAGNDIVFFTANLPTSIAVYGFGGPGNDQLTGAPGRNVLEGDGGVASGADGRDKILGRQSNDELVGNGGNDIIYGYGGSDTIRGDAGADQLYGDDEAGDLSGAPSGFGSGSAGNDTIEGGDDGDTILGGDGDDTLSGDSGDDTIDGGAGDDRIEGDGGNDKLYGRGGNDYIWGEDRLGTITYAGSGFDDGSDIDVNADLIEGGLGFNFLSGGPGYDIIYAESEEAGVAAAAAHAAVDISSGAFVSVAGSWLVVDSTPLWTALGGDPARGSTLFASVLIGGDGNDTLYGTAGRDYISGGFESDFLAGGEADDYLLGGPGSDAIFAGGPATIFAGDGDDVVDGGDGDYDNWIEGGPGDDRIYARGGEDTVYGGTTGAGYQHYEDDRGQGRAVVAAIHGGYTATVSADDCGPDISWYPEVYPEDGPPIEGLIYEDLNLNGVRDPGEPEAPKELTWGFFIGTAAGELLGWGPAPGGSFTLPPEGGLPEGDYRVDVPPEFAPAGWMPTPLADTFAFVTTAIGSPSPLVSFGWYRAGSIDGKVDTRDGAVHRPAEGVVLYLDENRDGEYDAGEQTAVTDAAGKYAFTGLVPGGYSVRITDVQGCVEVTPAAAEVTLASGQSRGINFTISPRSAPVVDGVLLGASANTVSWTDVPDGAAQSAPLPQAAYNLLAFEICVGVGLGETTGGAVMVAINPDGSNGPAITLRFLGPDPAKPTRLRYAIEKPLGNDVIPAGRYRVLLPDASVKSATGQNLDGEWINPGPLAPAGSQFPSGNGTAGGNFVFEFTIGNPGVLSLAGLGDISVQALQSVVQGTVWQHDPRDPDLGQSATERAVGGQTVKLLDSLGRVVASQVSRRIDLDGDGIVRGPELAAFRFTNVAPGTYTVVQETVRPWAQATPGGVLEPAGLLAGTFDSVGGKSTISAVDPVTLATRPLFDTPRLALRDLAVADRDTAWLTGTAQAGNVMAPGTAGLWRAELASGVITEVGPTPGNKPLFSLDVLDGNRLLGVTISGDVLLYDTVAGTWTSRGPLLTAAGQQLYPVGDAAVVAADEVYVVALLAPNDTMSDNAAGQQKLVRLDPTAVGVNATIVRDIVLSELLVGLETTATGDGLIALGNRKGVYAVPAAVAGVISKPGNLSVATAVTFGGLAGIPAGIETDPTRQDFLLTLRGGEKIEVGFGNEPKYTELPDGDDTIDGGCGDDPDRLFGDDGPKLPWFITTVGGNDTIRGRGGDDLIEGGQQGDRLLGEAGADTIKGGDSEPNWIDGGDDNDELVGGEAGDTIFGGAGNDAISGAGGADALFGDGGRGGLTAGSGGTGQPDGDDLLSGGDGPDVLVGGGGTDKVFGDDGDDVLVVIDTAAGGAYGADPSGTSEDLYDGGSGTDTILVVDDTDTTLTDGFVRLAGVVGDHPLVSIEVGLLTGGESANTIDAAGFSGTTAIRGKAAADLLIGGSGIDLIEGGAGGDTIQGNDGADDLWGGVGNDTIDGGAGDDAIRGGGDSNQLTGGADDDTFIYEPDASRPNDRILDGAAAGNDTLDMTAVVDGLTMIVGDGSATRVRISGYPPVGSVEFDAAAIERVLLGSGSDLVYLRDGVSTVAEIDAGGGEDHLLYAETSGSFEIPGGVWSTPVTVDLAAGTATGTGGVAGFERVTGGAAGDTLRGDDGPNTLDGGDGNDTLDGRGGDDSLLGGAGDDSLSGGSGADSLTGQGGTNTLAGGTGHDTYYWFSGDAPIDTVTEAIGVLGGNDTLDFSGIDQAIRFEIGAGIVATYGAATITAAAAGGIETVRGGGHADRFVLADGTAFGGLLDGGAIQGLSFAEMNTLDYGAWTAAVTVDYTGQVDANFLGTATGTGNVRNLQHVIGGGAADSLSGGGMPVWFEGGDGDDTLTGSFQGDLLEGQAGDDSIAGGFGNDILRGGLGADILAGGFGNDTYSFMDLFGNDTIIENPGEGSDTMDFALVTVPLEIRLGSVTVTDGSSTAIHAGDGIEAVIGGLADDEFVMTGPTVVFPGTLDGGGGTNSLTYRRATPGIIAAVDAGQTPNVSGIANIASVTAVPPVTIIDITVPLAGELIDTTIRSGDERIVKKGAGRLILTAANSHMGGTIVEAGELVIRNLAALGSGGLEVMAGATVTLDVGFGTVPLADLVLATGAVLELGTGRITIAAGATEVGLRQWILAGRGSGGWNGTDGIRSAAATASPASRALGYRVNPDGSAVVMFTAVGDTNLDGTVNVFDLVGVNTGGRYGSTATATWSDGDVTYDGRVNAFDLVGITSGGAFNTGSVIGAASSSSTFAALAAPTEGLSSTTLSQPSAATLSRAFAALAVEEWGLSATGSDATKKKASRTN